MTELHDACKSGDLDLVKQLLEQGADANARDDDNMTPLLCACEAGHLPVAKYLIEEKNCSIEDRDKLDYDSLTFACWKGHLSLVKYLIEERNAEERGKNYSIFACSGRSLQVVRYLVEERHNDVSHKDNQGRNGLMWACLNGVLPIVQYMIEQHHVNTEEKDKEGKTCLTLACRWNRMSVVKYLIIDCWMDPPKSFISIRYRNEVGKFLRKCNSKYLNEQRRRKFIAIKDFIHQYHLNQMWCEQQNEAFHQQVPLEVSHAYQLVLSDPSRFSDLKVCFEAAKESSEWTGEKNLVTVYAQKNRLSESCTFMKNLLSDNFNDVQGGTEDDDMPTVHLSQELLQGCPSDWLKQLLIYLAWSKKGDQLHHHANALYEGNLSLRNIHQVLRYCRTCSALELDIDFASWMQLIEKYLERFNQEWIDSTLESGEVDQEKDRCISEIPALGQEMFDLWTQVMEENDVLYFFLLVNSAPATLESPETTATECREWLLSPKASGKYAETLKNPFFISALHAHLGFNFKTGKVYIPVDEEFVKRRRLE